MSMQELMNIWTKLDSEDQDELLGFAYKLSDRLVLKGGPYDGLRLDPQEIFNSWINVKHGDGVVAVYLLFDNEEGFGYVFERFKKTGEGCMPHIYPNRGNQ